MTLGHALRIDSSAKTASSSGLGRIRRQHALGRTQSVHSIEPALHHVTRTSMIRNVSSAQLRYAFACLICPKRGLSRPCSRSAALKSKKGKTFPIDIRMTAESRRPLTILAALRLPCDPGGPFRLRERGGEHGFVIFADWHASKASWLATE